MSGVMVRLQCGRVDCERVEDVDVALLDVDVRLDAVMPDGWGVDYHDGINAALHCPDHRDAPTEEEVAEIMRLHGGAS